MQHLRQMAAGLGLDPQQPYHALVRQLNQALRPQAVRPLPLTLYERAAKRESRSIAAEPAGKSPVGSPVLGCWG
jgi:hypothetical protein